MKQRLISLTLALMMLLSILPNGVFAAGNGLTEPQLQMHIRTWDENGEGVYVTSRHEYPVNDWWQARFFMVYPDGSSKQIDPYDLWRTSEIDLINVDADGWAEHRTAHIGPGKIGYTENGVDYIVEVEVTMPDLGMYKHMPFDESTLVDRMTLSESGDVYYIALSQAMLDQGLRMSKIDTVFDDIYDPSITEVANVSLSPDGSYAKVSFDDPSIEGDFHFQAQIVNADGDHWGRYGRSVCIKNDLPGLYVCNVYYEDTGLFVNHDSARRDYWTTPDSRNSLCFYFGRLSEICNGMAAPLMLEELSFPAYMTAEYLEDDRYPVPMNAISLETRRFAENGEETDITYMSDEGKLYRIAAEPCIPELGIYTDMPFDKSTLTNTMILSEPDCIYYIALSQKVLDDGIRMNAIRTDGDLQDVAKISISADGTYAKVILCDTYAAGDYEFRVDIVYPNGNIRGDWGRGVRIKNDLPGLYFCYADRDDATESWFINHDQIDNQWYTTPGYSKTGSFYFGKMSEIRDGKVKPLPVEDIDFHSGLRIKELKDDYTPTPNLLCVETTGFDTKYISYTNPNGVTYLMQVRNELPEIGIYRNYEISENSFVHRFNPYTITENDRILYILSSDPDERQLTGIYSWDNREIDELFDVYTDPNGECIKLLARDDRIAPNGTYHLEVECRDRWGNSFTEGLSLALRNGQPTLMLRHLEWDDKNQEWFEPKDRPLETSLNVHTGDDFAVRFYYGTEDSHTAVDLDELDFPPHMLRAYEEDGIQRLEITGYEEQGFIHYPMKDGKMASMQVYAEAPHYGFYTTPAPSKGTFLGNGDLTLGGTAHPVVYLVARPDMQICDIEYIRNTDTGEDVAHQFDVWTSPDGSHAAIKLNPNDMPEGNRHYEFRIRNQYGGDWHVWFRLERGDLPQLAMPHGLEWHVEYERWYDENDNITYHTKDRMGMMSFHINEGDLSQNRYRVEIFSAEDGFMNPVEGGTWGFGDREEIVHFSLSDFIYADLPSGDYAFRVRAEGDGEKYRSSDWSPMSPIFQYVQPTQRLDAPDSYLFRWELWDDGIYHSTWEPNGQAETGYYEIKWSAETENGVRRENYGNFDMEVYQDGGNYVRTEFDARIHDGMLSDYGMNDIRFRVRAIPVDITKYRISKWSGNSAPLEVENIADDINGKLDDILYNSPTVPTVQDVQDALFNSTGNLRVAMAADPSISGGTGGSTLDRIHQMEKIVADNVDQVIDAKNGAPQNIQDIANGITMIGATLNLADKNPGTGKNPTVTLEIDAPKKGIVIEEQYHNAVQFSMKLNGAVDKEDWDDAGQQLIVPVAIDMPIPAGINGDFLVVLHQLWDGTIEQLDPYVYWNNGTQMWHARFVVDSFSDFALVELHQTDDDDDWEEDEPVTPPPAPDFTVNVDEIRILEPFTNTPVNGIPTGNFVVRVYISGLPANSGGIVMLGAYDAGGRLVQTIVMGGRITYPDGTCYYEETILNDGEIYALKAMPVDAFGSFMPTSSNPLEINNEGIDPPTLPVIPTLEIREEGRTATFIIGGDFDPTYWNSYIDLSIWNMGGETYVGRAVYDGQTTDGKHIYTFENPYDAATSFMVRLYSGGNFITSSGCNLAGSMPDLPTAPVLNLIPEGNQVILAVTGLPESTIPSIEIGAWGDGSYLPYGTANYMTYNTNGEHVFLFENTGMDARDFQFSLYVNGNFITASSLVLDGMAPADPFIKDYDVEGNKVHLTVYGPLSEYDSIMCYTWDGFKYSYLGNATWESSNGYYHDFTFENTTGGDLTIQFRLTVGGANLSTVELYVPGSAASGDTTGLLPTDLKLQHNTGSGLQLQMTPPTDPDLIEGRTITYSYNINNGSKIYNRNLKATIMGTTFLTSYDGLQRGQNTIEVTLTAKPTAEAIDMGYAEQSCTYTFYIYYMEETTAFDASNVKASISDTATDKGNMKTLTVTGLLPGMGYQVTAWTDDGTYNKREFVTDTNGTAVCTWYSDYDFTHCTIAEWVVTNVADNCADLICRPYAGTFAFDEKEEVNQVAVPGGIAAIRQSGMYLQVDMIAPESMDNISYFALNFYNSNDRENTLITGITCPTDHLTFYPNRYVFKDGIDYDKVEIVAYGMNGYENAVWTGDVEFSAPQLQPGYIYNKNNIPMPLLEFDQGENYGFFCAEFWNASVKIGETFGDYLPTHSKQTFGVQTAEAINAIENGTGSVVIYGWDVKLEDNLCLTIYNYTDTKCIGSEGLEPEEPEQPACLAKVSFENHAGCVYMTWTAEADAPEGNSYMLQAWNGSEWIDAGNFSPSYAVTEGRSIFTSPDLQAGTYTKVRTVACSWTSAGYTETVWFEADCHVTVNTQPGTAVTTFTKNTDGNYTISVSGLTYDRTGAQASMEFALYSNENGATHSCGTICSETDTWTTSDSHTNLLIENGEYRVREYQNIKTDGTTASFTIFESDWQKCIRQDAPAGEMGTVTFSSRDGFVKMSWIAPAGFTQLEGERYMVEAWNGSEWILISRLNRNAVVSQNEISFNSSSVEGGVYTKVRLSTWTGIVGFEAECLVTVTEQTGTAKVVFTPVEGQADTYTIAIDGLSVENGGNASVELSIRNGGSQGSSAHTINAVSETDTDTDEDIAEGEYRLREYHFIKTDGSTAAFTIFESDWQKCIRENEVWFTETNGNYYLHWLPAELASNEYYFVNGKHTYTTDTRYTGFNSMLPGFTETTDITIGRGTYSEGQTEVLYTLKDGVIVDLLDETPMTLTGVASGSNQGKYKLAPVNAAVDTTGANYYLTVYDQDGKIVTAETKSKNGYFTAAPYEGCTAEGYLTRTAAGNSITENGTSKILQIEMQRTPVSDAPITFAKPAAEITEVSTFDELDAALCKGGTVKLMADLSGSSIYADSGAPVTLDLNGHSLTAKFLFVKNGKELTITGGENKDGVLNIQDGQMHYGVTLEMHDLAYNGTLSSLYNKENAKSRLFALENVQWTASDDGSIGSAILLQWTDRAELIDTNVTGAEYSALEIRTAEDVYVSGGTYTCNSVSPSAGSSASISLQECANATIENVTGVSTKYGLHAYFCGTVDVIDCDLTAGNTYSAVVEASNTDHLTIDGGTYTANYNYGYIVSASNSDGSVISILDGTFVHNNSTTYLFNTHRDNVELNITGGAFSIDPSKHLFNGYYANKTDDLWVVSQNIPEIETWLNWETVQNYRLEWSPVSFADKYRLSVYEGTSASGTPVLTRTPTVTFYNMMNPIMLLAGETDAVYSVKVEALNSKNEVIYEVGTLHGGLRINVAGAAPAYDFLVDADGQTYTMNLSADTPYGARVLLWTDANGAQEYSVLNSYTEQNAICTRTNAFASGDRIDLRIFTKYAVDDDASACTVTLTPTASQTYTIEEPAVTMNPQVSGNTVTVYVRGEFANGTPRLEVYRNGTEYLGDAMCSYTWGDTHNFYFENPYTEASSFTFRLIGDNLHVATSQPVELMGR